MCTNQYYHHRIYKVLASLCLVLFVLIAIFAGNIGWAMAQELSSASDITGAITPFPPSYYRSGRGGEKILSVILHQEGINQKLSEDGSPAVEQKQFPFEPKSGILAEVNQKFHEDYDKLIAEITSTFGQPGGPTVLVFSMQKLIIHHNGKTEEQKFIPPLYHQLKAIEHHPLTLYGILQSVEGQKLTDSLRDFLVERSNLLQEALNNLNTENWPQNIVENQKALLTNSIEYINQVLVEDYINSEKLNNYVRLVSPKIIRGVNSAAAAELELINEKIKKLLSKEKWQSPYVVICGVHQARHGEVVTQYFERVFNELQGNAAEREDRIIYAESILDDEPRALRLLATHILDRKLSSAFFRDSRRLQSDALMNAANFWLWEHTMDLPKFP